MSIHSIIDRLLILAGCLIISGLNAKSIVAVTLFAFIISAFELILDKAGACFALTVFYIIVFCFVPECGIFLPLIVYGAVYKLEKRSIILLAAAFICSLFSENLMQNVISTFLLLISVLTAYRSHRLDLLEKENFRWQDSSSELKILMNERQQELLKNQDNQIHLATLSERNRIAREIHDNVGHMLSRSILMVGALNTLNKDESMKEPLSDLKDTLSQAMDSIRKSVHNLHDEAIDLEANARRLAKEFEFCPVKLDFDMSSRVDREVKYCFIAVLKEALANVIKHSGATEVTVLMREHPAMYQLQISDNGKGYCESEDNNGIGLLNMEERVNKLNGRLTITGDNGYKIFIMIPKKIEAGEKN